MKLVVLYGLITSVFLSFGSCKNTDDEFLPDDVLPPVPEGYVRMQITVPGLTPVPTYALNPDNGDESEVSEVDVLVFGSDSKYLCYAEGKPPVTDAVDKNKKTFDVDLKDAGGATGVYIMVIANARSKVVSAKSNFTATTDTTAVKQALVFDSPTTGKWSTSTPFPMWGHVFVNDLSSTAGIPNIKLTRSVAKIDVGVNFNGETAQGLSPSFVIEKVILCNSFKEMFIAPGKGAASPVPSIPPAPTTFPDIEYLYSNGANDGFSNSISCMNAIYMTEHAAGDKTTLTANPYLIIQGKYNSGSSSFYRLDFADSGGDPQPVLRNRRYRFNIKTLTGSGYSDINDAKTLRPVNLTYDLSATDESLASYVYNGQYALGVSRDSYTMDKAARTVNTLKVSTTFPYGYTATSDRDWLKFGSDFNAGTSTVSGAANSLDDLTFSVSANGNTDRTPSATITIISGPLTKKVTVNQSGKAGFEVTPFESSYPAAGGIPNTLPTVTSSYAWRVNVESDPDAIVETFTTNGTGDGSFSFTLKDNRSAYSGSISTATLKFFSPTGEFDPVYRYINMPGAASAYTPTAHRGWAGSNIYWDATNSCLTFDDTPDTNPTGDATGHEGYQGVFFKWGSLIGIDPMRGDAGATWTNSSSNTNKVYVPDASVPSGWRSVTAGASSTYYTWGNIPYADASIIGNETLPARARLYEITTPANIANHRGDICRYLTETGKAPGADKGTKWRIPVANEFSGATADYPIKPSTNTSWPDYTGTFAGNVYGTWIVKNASNVVVGRRKTNDVIAGYQPFFSVGGDRFSNGVLQEIGVWCDYWSASPYNSSDAIDLACNSGNAYPADPSSREYSFPVRCVKE
ncbi:MAG: FimB/Mfa2 family fimbrial subunit [Prevotella sp.]|jgi:hypothetical protein|nr:FimB/Mfa2 family fimbrial subunit [Prevotella sp.]